MANRGIEFGSQIEAIGKFPVWQRDWDGKFLRSWMDLGKEVRMAELLGSDGIARVDVGEVVYTFGANLYLAFVATKVGTRFL